LHPHLPYSQRTRGEPEAAERHPYCRGRESKTQLVVRRQQRCCLGDEWSSLRCWIQLFESGFDMVRTTRLSEKYRRMSHDQLLLLKVGCRCWGGAQHISCSLALKSPRRHCPQLQPHSPTSNRLFGLDRHSTSSWRSGRQVQSTESSLLQIWDD
jgi:hypothetical protein